MNALDSGSELFLACVDRMQRSIADANRQITSGKKISTAADSPDQIGQLLQLRASRLHNSQIQSNLALAKSDADSADSALSEAIKLMDRAVVVASTGSNTSQTVGDRQTMANEVESLQEQMVSYSQTAVQGRYLFSGDQSDAPAYTFDASQLATNPVVTQSTASSTQQIEDPQGGSFSAAKTAQEIFDDRTVDGPTTSNVFEALNQLRLALAGGDPAKVAAAGVLVKQASAHLSAMQAFYGVTQTRIQSATNYASTYDVQLRTQISQIEDADAAGAALQLTQATTQLQASFEMRAKLPHTSLFDYLG